MHAPQTFRVAFVALPLLAAGGCVDSGDDGGEVDFPPDVQAVVDRLAPLSDCPERIWPGAAADAFRASQVLFTSGRSGDAYLWRIGPGALAGSPRASLVDASTLDEAWFAAFNVGIYRGVPTLGISLEEATAVDAAVAAYGGELWQGWAVQLVFHEGFHAFVQRGWLRDDGGTFIRGTPYPEQPLPRYFRAELSRALRAELEQPGGLGTAAYWQSRFVSETAEAAMRTRDVDVVEGTAQYATLAGAALAELGCDAGEVELHQTALAHLDEFAENPTFGADYEAYALGALAGLVLRRDGHAGWEAAATEGTPPAESLLSSVTPLPAADDLTLRAAVEQTVATRNSSRAPAVEALLARLASDEYYRLPVSPAWVEGSFSTAGFLTLVDEPDQPAVTLTIATTLLVPASSARISLTGTTALEATGALPCSGDFDGGWILTVPKANVAATQTNRYTAVDGEIGFSDLPATVVREAELDWLCP